MGIRSKYRRAARLRTAPMAAARLAATQSPQPYYDYEAPETATLFAVTIKIGKDVAWKAQVVGHNADTVRDAMLRRWAAESGTTGQLSITVRYAKTLPYVADTAWGIVLGQRGAAASAIYNVSHFNDVDKAGTKRPITGPDQGQLL